MRDMTFAVVLSSRTAIWACADRQLTVRQSAPHSSKAGVKITCIETSDGMALLTYAGIGRVHDTQVSRWVYRTLRGINMSLERSLEHVWSAGQRRLLGHARRAGTGHLFIASAIRDGKHYVYVIDLLKQDAPQVIRIEPRTRTNVKIAIAGSGALVAQRYETSRMRQLGRLVRQYERANISAAFIASQLAALNVTVSKRAREAGDNTISAESVVIHRHPKSKTRPAGRFWCFDDAGKPINDSEAVVPTVACGFPVTDLGAMIMADLLRRMRTLPPNPTAEQFAKAELMPDDATLRAIGNAVPDTPDEQFR